MEFPEFDATLQRLIRATIYDCIGVHGSGFASSEEDREIQNRVDSCATQIERLAVENFEMLGTVKKDW